MAIKTEYFVNKSINGYRSLDVKIFDNLKDAKEYAEKLDEWFIIRRKYDSNESKKFIADIGKDDVIDSSNYRKYIQELDNKIDYLSKQFQKKDLEELRKELMIIFKEALAEKKVITDNVISRAVYVFTNKMRKKQKQQESLNSKLSNLLENLR